MCYVVINGEWIMPKPILLTMTIRHLTESGDVMPIIESGEVITITGMGMTN